MFFLLIGILVVVGIILLGFSFSLPNTDKNRSLFAIAGIAVLLPGSLIVTACSTFHSVQAGNIGVVYTFGKITAQTGAGLVTTAPWADLEPASIQVQKYTDGNVQAVSKETQNVTASVTVNYQVSPVAIQQLYSNVGPNYQDVLIPARVSNFFKEETAKYDAVDVTPNRETIRTAVRDKLKAELEPYSITVNDLLIDNIHFDDAFTKAIEAKQVATQNAQAEANNVAVSQAKGQQTAAEAAGQAQAISTINSALAAAPNYIQYLEAQKFTQSWDGKLPLVVGAGEPLITVPSTQPPGK